MALVGCRECGKEVSTSASHCPHCGASAPAPGNFAVAIIAAVVCAIIGIAALLMFRF